MDNPHNIEAAPEMVHLSKEEHESTFKKARRFRPLSKNWFKNQVWVNSAKPNAKKFDEPKNRMWHKPQGGMWTSTLHDVEGSDWITWCHGAVFRQEERNQKVFKLEFDPSSKVYVIDSIDDYYKLKDQYRPQIKEGMSESEKRGVLLMQQTSMTALDFESIVKDWDAIHLTKRGEAVTKRFGFSIFGKQETFSEWRLRQFVEKGQTMFSADEVREFISLTDKLDMGLDGWDCESTVWLKWKVVKFKYLGKVVEAFPIYKILKDEEYKKSIIRSGDDAFLKLAKSTYELAKQRKSKKRRPRQKRVLREVQRKRTSVGMDSPKNRKVQSNESKIAKPTKRQITKTNRSSKTVKS